MAYRQRAIKNISGLGICVALAACGAEPKVQNEPASTAEEIMGGVSAESPTLDAVGALAYVYPMWGGGDAGDAGQYVSPFCSATLIGPASVLTAKHCLQGYGRGGESELYFAMGSETSAPKRLVKIVDVEFAQPTYGGYVGMGADLAVAHLEERVLDVPVRGLAALDETMINRRLVAMGYGLRDNSWNYGTRRMGSVTVRALSGPVFAHMFGSYEAFEQWWNGNGYYAGYDGALLNVMAPTPVLPGLIPDAVTAKPSRPPVPARDSGAPDVVVPDDASEDTRPLPDVGADDGLPFEPDADGGHNSYARYLYDNTMLFGDHEVYVGNQPGDAQPCRGDSGGPILGRAADGSVRIFGVASWALRSQRSECDFGAVYARFSPSNLAWAQTASAWVDPCDGVSHAGRCEGDVATRCTQSAEGPRRVTRTDCAEIGLVCGAGIEGATCVEPSLR